MLGQSQSQARDLAQQMGERLKVTEAMLAEATKARENLVADNASAVEGLLATISSKDQLLKVCTTSKVIALHNLVKKHSYWTECVVSICKEYKASFFFCLTLTGVLTPPRDAVLPCRSPLSTTTACCLSTRGRSRI